MSISRTEVERRRDQAQRDRANMAQVASDRQEEFFPPESLFQPPSRVQEETYTDETDDTTLKFESLFGPWENIVWESGNPIVKHSDQVSDRVKSPSLHRKPATDSNPPRNNGDHRHPSHARASSQPTETKPMINHQQNSNSRYRNESLNRSDSKSVLHERTSSSGSGSRVPSSQSHKPDKVRPPPSHSSQPLSQGSSPSPKTKHSSQLTPQGMVASPKTKHNPVPPPVIVPPKRSVSPAVIPHERDRDREPQRPPPTKDLAGSVKPGADHHHGFRPSSSARPPFSDKPSAAHRGPSTPPFPPPSSHHTPHRTPPPPHRTPPPQHRSPPPPHRTPPPPHRTPPPPHRTPPPHHPPPQSHNAVGGGRSHLPESKPNLTLNIKKEKQPGDLDDIFKEMELSTPLTGLSETPVKCKKAPSFKFLGKTEDDDMKLKPPISPLQEPEPIQVKHEPQAAPVKEPLKESISLDLKVSDDSDVEEEKPVIKASEKATTASEKPTADIKKDDGHSSSDGSSSDSDSSSGSDSGSSSSESGDENEEEEEEKKEKMVSPKEEAAKPVPRADTPDQNPSGGWGLSQFIKKQASPGAVQGGSQPASDPPHSKVSSDEDVASKVKASPRKMAEIGHCNTMPFIAHDDSDPITRNNDIKSVSPASSHASSLDTSKGGKRRDSGSDTAPPPPKPSLVKPGAGLKCSPARPRLTSSSSLKASIGVESGISVDIPAPTAAPASKTPAQRKRRRTNSSGGGKKVPRVSPAAAISSSSEVDVESLTPPDTKCSKIASSSVSDSAAKDGKGEEVSRQLFIKSPSLAVAAAIAPPAPESKKPVILNKDKTPNRRESHHNAKKATKKSASDCQGGGATLNGGKSSSSKAALTDIGSIMEDIQVPKLLSPNIPAGCGREPLYIPTLTCGKPSIVVRLRLDRLHRAPEGRAKGGKSSKSKLDAGATVTPSVSARSAMESGHKGAASKASTPKTSSHVKSGGGGSGGGGGSDVKRKGGDSVPAERSSSSLPSGTSPSALPLPAKRKKEKEHSVSAKKQKGSHSSSKPASASSTPAHLLPEINGIVHPGESPVRKAGGKRLTERRGSTSSTSSRSSHKHISKKLRPDPHPEKPPEKPAVHVEPKVNGKDLPFNSYKPDSQPTPSPKPTLTPPPRSATLDVDNDPLATSEHRMESTDFYMHKAKELKHLADKMRDKQSKLVPYIKSVLYFILWGHSFEKQPTHVPESQNAAPIFNDTYNLQMHVNRLRLGVLNDNVPTERDRKLSVLILRIQSLLCLKLYNFKKSEVMKLKKVIDSEQNKGSSMKVSVHAPSPHQNHWNKNSTGTPSPMSPTPSPACSIGSVESQGSCEQSGSKMTNGNMNSNAMSSPGTISVPQRIHTVTQKYVHFTNHLLQCHDFWDQSDAEVRAHNLHGFFKHLDNRYGPLSLHSSMTHLVTYANGALKELNSS